MDKKVLFDIVASLSNELRGLCEEFESERLRNDINEYLDFYQGDISVKGLLEKYRNSEEFRLFNILGFSDVETVIFLFSVLPYVDKGFMDIYKALSEAEYLTVSFADELSQRIFKTDINSIDLLSKWSDVNYSYTDREYVNDRNGLDVIWECARSKKSGFAPKKSYEFRLCEWVIAYFLDASNDYYKHFNGITCMSYDELLVKKDIEIIPIKDEYLDMIQAESKVLLIFGEEGIGKKYIVFDKCVKDKKGIIIVDYDSVKHEKRSSSMIKFYQIVFDANLCVQKNDEELENEEVKDFLSFLRCLSEDTNLFWVMNTEKEEPKLMIMAKNSMTFGYDGFYSFRMTKHTKKEQKEIWNYFSSVINDDELLAIAERFDFSIEKIKRAVHLYEKEIICHPDFDKRKLFVSACYSQLNHRLKEMAVKVSTNYSMDDLVLSDSKKALISDILNQVIYRNKVYEELEFYKTFQYGNGVSALFYGTPGTGKTMAAQIIAGNLGMEMYKINLSTVVSKYIGETEKNLSLIFEEAKKSQAILFFDEADVLFSKRTEVKDSNDKYSNMEAAFLLQKMDEYQGMVILATNYVQNIDEAFKRRLGFIIEFQFPGPEERLAIWNKIFPEKVTISSDVDFEFIAKQFELSGSNIKTAAVAATFMAVAEGDELSMRHLIKSIVRELEKYGKKVTKAELGIYGDE